MTRNGIAFASLVWPTWHHRLHSPVFFDTRDICSNQKDVMEVNMAAASADTNTNTNAKSPSPRTAKQKQPPDEAARPLVIVTGAGGLIGAPLVERLAKTYAVVGLDVAEQPESLAALGNVDWLKCDPTEDADVQATLEKIHKRHGNRIAAVVHLAAYYDFSGEPSPLYQQLTIDGTRRLLRALSTFDVVERFIFSSSLLAMKPVELGQTINENSPTQAEWDYPKSKLAAEQVIKEQRGDIPAAIARLAGAYDEHGHSPPLANQIARIYERNLESHLFPGDVDHGQSFVHLDDAVEALALMVDKRSAYADYEVFLIGEREVLSYGKLQDTIGQLIHGKDWTTMRIPKVVAKAGAWAKDKMAGEDDKPFIKPWMIDLADAHYAIDVKKARHWLGWQPEHSLRDTLPDMVRSLLANPEGWYRENGLPVPEGARA